MAKWLVKSEPFKYSWDDMVRDGTTHWDGVRNYQALNNMRAMKKGDLAFFYHSNEGKEIVGIVEIVKEFYPDPNDERSGLVDVKAHKAVPNPVTLKAIKADEGLHDIALVRQSRLSVMPIDDESWDKLSKMGGL
ncbi:MAG: EVE domain-containing protein [Sphingomonadales bacterium]|jgi:predicted RNA-binding protein with PUA-like domain